MRINDISQLGIFQYVSGIQYEKGDLILHNNTLYIVTANLFLGDKTPDQATSYCTPYTEYHGIDIDDPEKMDNSRLVTAAGLRSIINTMFKGLSLGGEISTLDMVDNNLDNYKSTGAYLIKITNDLTSNQFILNSKGSTALMRIYKSAGLTIQEVIDYSLPIIYYRYAIDDKNWAPWLFLTNGDGDTITQARDAIKEYQNKVLEYTEKIKLIENRSRIYLQEHNWKPINGIPQTIVNRIEIKEKSILQVGIIIDWKANLTENDPPPLQEWITIDLSLVDNGMAIGSNGAKVYFKVHYTSNQVSHVSLELKKPAINAGIFKILIQGKY